jgi:hypothetical protein
MKIYIVLNDSDILDHPNVTVFTHETKALQYIKELYFEYWQRSECDAPPFDIAPETLWNGDRYDFEGGYCCEWCYLIEENLIEGSAS